MKIFERTRTTVIGAGNPIVGDDGIGIAALDLVRRNWQLDGGVELVDGGTWGMNLLPLIESTDRLIILDAVRGGAQPGEVVRLERDELPRFLSLKLSPHQIDLREVLALAELRDTLPRDILVLGIQPERIEMGIGLSAPVQASLERLVQLAIQQLRDWGHVASPIGEAVHA